MSDFVTGRENNGYCITTKKALMKIKCVEGDFISLQIVGHVERDRIGEIFEHLPCSRFISCSIQEFKDNYPNAILMDNLEDNLEDEESKPLSVIMEGFKEHFVLTNAERDRLAEKEISLLEEYDYHPTIKGVTAGIREWAKNKGWLIKLFEKSPDYKGNYQIAYKVKLDRKLDTNVMGEFCDAINDILQQKLKDFIIKYGVFTYKEIETIHQDIYSIIAHLSRLPYPDKVIYDGLTYSEWRNEFEHWEEVRIQCADADGYKLSNGELVIKSKYYLYRSVKKAIERICSCKQKELTEQDALKINEYLPEIKVVAGMKLSRIMRKICDNYGLSKINGFEQAYAKFADAVNPKQIPYWLVLSLNPLDYLTMSFGNSWSSCHTIDRRNRRGMENGYHGMYSAGTMSYMLDGTSIVAYLVDDKYIPEEENNFETQPKIMRNMFHIDEDKIVQGRVYPKSTDGNDSYYKKIRDLVLPKISECFGISVEWETETGTSSCDFVINSKGRHYRDYLNFKNCNVNFITSKDTRKNYNMITIGHNAICPCCGKSHTREASIECGDCE